MHIETTTKALFLLSVLTAASCGYDYGEGPDLSLSTDAIVGTSPTTYQTSGVDCDEPANAGLQECNEHWGSDDWEDDLDIIDWMALQDDSSDWGPEPSSGSSTPAEQCCCEERNSRGSPVCLYATRYKHTCGQDPKFRDVQRCVHDSYCVNPNTRCADGDGKQPKKQLAH